MEYKMILEEYTQYGLLVQFWSSPVLQSNPVLK